MLANRLRAIQGASRWLQALLVLLAILFVINRINALMRPFSAEHLTLVGVVFHKAAITHKIQMLWIAQLGLATVLSLKVIYHFARLLGSLAQDRLFTAQQVAQVRQVAITLAFAPAIWLAILIGAWPEIAAAQDQWVNVMPSFPGDAIISSCVIMFASRLMNESRELRDDHDLVI